MAVEGCQAAIWYSLISPPRTCFRRIKCSARWRTRSAQVCLGASCRFANAIRATLNIRGQLLELDVNRHVASGEDFRAARFQPGRWPIEVPGGWLVEDKVWPR